MPLYTYIAIDPSGERVSGQFEASDPDSVVSRLTAQGLRTESVQLARLPAEPELVVRTEPTRVLRPSDAREIGSHIAEIASAGLPLETGLAAIAEELPRGRLKRALRKIVADLETGNDLESALAARKSPAYLAALVRAGRRSGRTGALLERFISSTRIVFDLRQTLAMALVYPAALLVVVLVISVLLQGWVVPEFAVVFDGFGIQLPWPTAVLVGASKVMSDIGLPVLAFVAIAALVTVIVSRLALGPVETRRLICRIPVIGPLVRWIALARFSPLLSLLIESRVPLDEALLLAGDASGDALIRDDCRRLAERIAAGESLETVARSGGGVPVSFVRAIGLEHERRGLPEVLQSMADIYAGRARALAALLAMVMPMLVVSFVGALVGVVVVALMWPLIELLSKLY